MMIRNREEREAINAPIQGTAADIMKLSMILVPQAIRSAGLKGSVLLQVHDELVIEVPEAEGVIQPAWCRIRWKMLIHSQFHWKQKPAWAGIGDI
jgi:hypothetical protein